MLNGETSMTKKIQKLTPAILRKMIIEEQQALASKNMKKVEADQYQDQLEKDMDQYKAVGVGQEKGNLPDGKMNKVEADGYADTLEKDIDHYSALKVKEAMLRKELKRLAEVQAEVRKRISESKSK